MYVKKYGRITQKMKKKKQTKPNIDLTALFLIPDFLFYLLFFFVSSPDLQYLFFSEPALSILMSSASLFLSPVCSFTTGFEESPFQEQQEKKQR